MQFILNNKLLFEINKFNKTKSAGRFSINESYKLLINIYSYSLIYYFDQKPILNNLVGNMDENEKSFNEILPINDCDVISYHI